MDSRLLSMTLASSMALVGARLDAGRGADGSLLDPGAVGRTVPQASPDAEIVAAHNTIYDNHNPLRCMEVIDQINKMPRLTAADIMAVSSMMIATVLSQMPHTTRASALAGVGMMARTMVMQHEAAADATDTVAGINPV